MKRIFFYLAAVSLLAACSEDDGITEIIDNGPETGGGEIENPVTGYTAYVEVATECGDTRATYDSALQPLWEENDVIALHQMAAAGGGASAAKSELAIKEGWGTPNAKFGAEVELTAADERYFCFAYPSAAAAFSTSDRIEAVGTIDYNFKQSTPGMGHYTATGTYKHVYTTSCGITIPTVQNGKWEPYMYAFTGESKPAEQLGSFRFKTLNGAICLHANAKDADGNTESKQLKEITIHAAGGQSIAGTFTCASACEGMLEPLAGDEGKLISTSINDQAGRDDALEKLENKARAASPASTTGNSVSEWSLSEGHNAITVTGLEDIEPNENGEYLYYINIAPVTGAKLEITLKDTDDFECMRTIEAFTLEANHRKGYNITWDEDSIAVEFDDQNTGELTTTYSSYLKGDIAAANNRDAHTIGGATIKGIAKLKGRYTQDQIAEYGCRLLNGPNIEDGTLVKEIKSNTAFELAFGDIAGQPLGEYVYYLYVRAKDGKEFTSDPKHIYITGLPYACDVSQNDGWTLSGDVRFESSYIELHQNNSGSSIERTFYVPADANINVIANSDFGCRKGSSTSNSFQLYLSNGEPITHNGEYFFSGYKADVHHFIDKTGILTASNPSIKMLNTGHNIACYTQISSFKLTYGAK